MDVLQELKEIQEMNARVRELERQQASPMLIRQAMQVAVKPEETDLSYQARILLYSYADDFIEAAAEREIGLSFQPDEASCIPQAVGCAYEKNRAQRGLSDEDNLVMISKELGCYLALTLCHAMEGKIKVQGVPVHPIKGLSSLLVGGIIITVALPGYRSVNPIEVANKVVRSVRITETGLTMNQRPILRLLEERKV